MCFDPSKTEIAAEKLVCNNQEGKEENLSWIFMRKYWFTKLQEYGKEHIHKKPCLITQKLLQPEQQNPLPWSRWMPGNPDLDWMKW